jgi:DNA polymerase I
MIAGFHHIVVADFEFEFGGHDSTEAAGRSGERPRPVCMVAKDLCTGQTWRLWRGEFPAAPPFPTGSDALFVAYYASAELGCFRALGWSKPAHILDLFTEFRDRTNGVAAPAGRGLVGALAYFGLDSIAAAEKDELRMLVLRGGPWSDNERRAILEYCETDIVSLERLLPAMLPRIDLPRAMLRGRFMAAAAAIEYAGTPVDTVSLELLRRNWLAIQDDLIAAIDRDYHVYDGRSFRTSRWAAFLARNNIPWPRLETGQLDLDDDAFRQMAKSYPIVAPIRELRSSLADLRLNDLAVGCDGRNRTILSAFKARTGRNQPSSSKYIFGPSVWIRSLIKPPPGHGVAYIDWAQQEFGIAAALSGDQAMMAAYRTGDPYLAFAKQAGAIPENVTRNSPDWKQYKPIRELYKQCALAVQYGMGPDSLAWRLGVPPFVARGLLQAHRETFRKFWRWSDAAVDCAMLHNALHTVFGWHIHVDADSNPRSLRNFPMQANGSEMLRLACCLGTERGIEICAAVHDAVLICAPLNRLTADILAMQAAMAEASRVVLDGFELGTDPRNPEDPEGKHVVRYPDRYSDDRGSVMWQRVLQLVANRATAAAKLAALRFPALERPGHPPAGPETAARPGL